MDYLESQILIAFSVLCFMLYISELQNFIFFFPEYPI